ncbi:hypothetical protein [Candidatus Viadribacter manganicus]|uniref:Lipoprotein n=1 Tax=Candidatus Viadribacter manganicus TaxID=1759059 RepID=A0A1B1AJU0_9PROT|nr:hypothetical protein [Candidatus Viadribacter manganicus]ANP46815.1 hypothetical protein ATE48_13280 [Candidatus Viadribacter manganicus]
MKVAYLSKVAFAGALLLLAACGQNGEQAATTEAPPAPQLEAYTWGAQAPSTFEAPSTMHLANGYGYAILANTAVATGDTVNARLTVQGATGRWVRVVLQRHCDSTAGDDATPINVELNGQPQTVEVSHTFQANYSCIRMSLMSMDSQPLNLTVSDLAVSKGAALRDTSGG